MKILLTAINAKYIHSNLAVYSLQAYAEAQGHKIERAEYTIIISWMIFWKKSIVRNRMC